MPPLFEDLRLPATFDAHVHLRSDAMMEAVVPTIRQGGKPKLLSCSDWPACRGSECLLWILTFRIPSSFLEYLADFKTYLGANMVYVMVWHYHILALQGYGIS